MTTKRTASRHMKAEGEHASYECAHNRVRQSRWALTTLDGFAAGTVRVAGELDRDGLRALRHFIQGHCL